MNDDGAGEGHPRAGSERPILAVALEGAGWHPAAWRWPGARAAELFGAQYWIDLVTAAERGVLDLVTLEDGLGVQSSSFRHPDDRTDQVRGRLDSVLLATRIAPRTRHIGIVPTVMTQHTEPFHLAAEIASLDFISGGRAGWRPQISFRESEARHFGPVDPGATYAPGAADRTERIGDLFREAADVVEVVRRLWDSWEDDAEIRDRTTGRFIDRDKLHYVDFEGDWFSVKGPSITPRSPQGQPLVAALAHSEVPYRFAAGSADLVFVTPQDLRGVTEVIAEVRAAEAAIERIGPPLRIVADLVVLLDSTTGGAKARGDHLDELDGRPFVSDALTFIGTPLELADLVEHWSDLGIDGFRFKPAVLTEDLSRLVDDVVPELQRRGVHPSGYADGSLRERLGFERPPSRYAPAPAGARG